jgi:Phage integrase family
MRLALGLGKLPTDAFVFGTVEGAVRDPDRLTQDWKRFATARGLPNVRLHGLRHSHASALIAGGTDPVVVSRRLGHGSAAITLNVYAHLFDRGDHAAAKHMDALLKRTKTSGANWVPIRQLFAARSDKPLKQRAPDFPQITTGWRSRRDSNPR